MMARRALRHSVGALAFAVSACAGGVSRGEPVTYVGKDLRTGEDVAVADYRGDVVLLSSWATWCEPCKEELPELDRLAQERADEGLTVVAVNVNTAGPAVRAIDSTVEQLGLTVPLWRDSPERFAGVFGAMGVPTNVLVHRDGTLAQVWNGALDLDDAETMAIIDEALDAPDGA